jgi:hypothetical protein
MLLRQALLLCLILIAAQSAQAETALLPFSCRGEITATIGQASRTEKDNLSLIVNVNKKTVSFDGDTFPITAVDEAYIQFNGIDKNAGISSEVHGQLDRITGALTVMRFLKTLATTEELYNYTMQCKPAKRLF